MEKKMTIQWSKKQEAAINVLGSNVLVSASAGAGKTTVLIGRLLKRMELDRVSLSEVIAMTFTELAALEMRKRLLRELNRRIGELENGSEAKIFLHEQILLLPSAQISTIHSFCLSLIKKYSYVIKVNPAMAENILDESQKSLLMDEAFNQLFESWSKDHKREMFDLLLHFDPRPESKDVFKENVYKLSNKLNTLVDPSAWLEKSFTNMSSTSFEDMDESLKQYIVMYYRWKVEDLISKANIIEKRMPTENSYINDFDDKGKAKISLVISETDQIKNSLNEILNNLSQFKYSEFREQVKNLHTHKFTSFPKIKNYPKVETYAVAVKKGYDALLAELYDEEEWFKDLPNILNKMQTMASFTMAFNEEYRKLKSIESVMDFDDMEFYALKILKDDVFKVRNEFTKRYKEIMVDEFQDTNYVQNEIVELISNGKNIFRVGDIKQSIYRFRNAEPSMMQGMISNPTKNNVVLYLDQNYRSKSSIVDFNNELFMKLMNFPELPSKYTTEDNVVIGNVKKQEGGPVVELHLLDLDTIEEIESSEMDDDESETNPSTTDYTAPDDMEEAKQEVDPYSEKESLADPKSKHITNQILYMKDKFGYSYRDFVVLVRTNDFKARMKKIFEDTGIPHQIGVKTGFFNSNAVQDVLLVINHLINPKDNINTVGLCLSKFIGLDESQCARLRIENVKYESYYDTFKRLFPTNSLSLNKLENECKFTNLIETLRLIYNFNDYYDQHCTKQQRANLDLLFDKALRFSEKSITLSEFLLLLKKVKDEDSGEAIPFTEEDDVVRVMTIHQSKGLEFKVVFYWSQGKIQVKDNKSPLLMDSILGYVFNTVRQPYRINIKNPIRKALEMKSSLDDVMEQLRVLYVALTRAEEKLIIVDISPKSEVANYYTSILNSLGPTNWILMSLKNNRKLKTLIFPKPSDPKPIITDGVIESTLLVVKKEKIEVEFKTPSSTHTKFTHFKLNFDTNIGANHGTLIHELFEKLPHQGVTESMVKELQSDISDSDLSAVMSFYENEIYTKLSQGKIHHEYPFYALIDNEVLHGYMDMVSFTDEATYLVDYKTDRVDSSETLLELYSDQLLAYTKVLKQLRPEQAVKTYLYSLSLKSFIPVI